MERQKVNSGFLALASSGGEREINSSKTNPAIQGDSVSKINQTRRDGSEVNVLGSSMFGSQDPQCGS